MPSSGADRWDLNLIALKWMSCSIRAWIWTPAAVFCALHTMETGGVRDCLHLPFLLFSPSPPSSLSDPLLIVCPGTAPSWCHLNNFLCIIGCFEQTDHRQVAVDRPNCLNRFMFGVEGFWVGQAVLSCCKHKDGLVFSVAWQRRVLVFKISFFSLFNFTRQFVFLNGQPANTFVMAFFPQKMLSFGQNIFSKLPLHTSLHIFFLFLHSISTYSMLPEYCVCPVDANGQLHKS